MTYSAASERFRPFIQKWPTTADFARAMQVPYQRAWRWYERDSIPPGNWTQLIVAGRKIGLDISVDALLNAVKNQQAQQMAEANKRSRGRRRRTN